MTTKTVELPVESLVARLSAGLRFRCPERPSCTSWMAGSEGWSCFLSDTISWGLDFDTEKWNTGIRLVAFRHLAARFVLLNFEAPAGGFTWTHSF